MSHEELRSVEGQKRDAAADGPVLVQSVSRALDLLDALSSEDLGLVELGRRTGQRPSTTHRMLATLSERGYVSRQPSGRYELGHHMSCLVLRRHARDRRLVEAAQPLMERVKKVGRSTVNLSVLEGSHVLFLAQAVDEGSAHALAGREVRIPAHVSASGKVLLAFRTPDAPSDDVLWDRAFKARFTEHSIVDHLGLRRELRITGERGFAIDAREYREDTCCVAAPVLDETGAAVAALSLSGFPAELRGTTISDLGELVARSASEVSSALGYRGPSRWPVCAA